MESVHVQNLAFVQWTTDLFVASTIRPTAISAMPTAKILKLHAMGNALAESLVYVP